MTFLHSKEQEAEGVQNGEAAARKLGITLLPAEHTPTDYTDAFAFITRERPDALVVGASAVNVANRHLIVEFAAERRLPAMYAPESSSVSEVSSLTAWTSTTSSAAPPDMWTRFCVE